MVKPTSGKLTKKEARMLAEIKTKPELLARVQKLVGSLMNGKMESANSIDVDLKYTKGPQANQRRRVSFFDRQDIANSSGEHRVMIATRGPDNEPGAAFVLHDEKGRPRGAFSVNNSGQPQIQLLDERGVTRLFIGLSAKGVPVILFRDEKGREVFGLSDSLTRWGLANKPDTVQLKRSEGDAGVTIGKTIFVGTVKGQPAVAAIDKAGEMRVALTADKKHSSIGIFRKDKELWSTPSLEEKPARKRGKGQRSSR